MATIFYDAPPPTAKQYNFAKSISQRLHIDMPDTIQYSVEGFKSYISKYSQDFYKLKQADKNEAHLLDLIKSVDEYEKEFDINIQ